MQRVYDHEGELKFYRQHNSKYVSQSFVEGMFFHDYDMVPVTTLPNNTVIDLLKMDIEGAEYKVINHMLDNKIYPKYLLVEFDLFAKGKDTNQETHKTINRLLSGGYNILKNDNGISHLF